MRILYERGGDLARRATVNKEIKDEWVKALRSGEYKQARKSLRKGNKYCCLGVLCDLSKKGKWTSDSKTPRDSCGRLVKEYKYVPELGTVGYGFLPQDIRAWAGMRSNSGHWSTEQKSLADMNDRGDSFKVIADVIEKNWEVL